MSGILSKRLKAKFDDGREIEFTRFSGEKGMAKRVSIAAVFDSDGKEGVVFDEPFKSALIEALGGKRGDKVYFDLFPNDGGPSKETGKAKPVREDW